MCSLETFSIPAPGVLGSALAESSKPGHLRFPCGTEVPLLTGDFCGQRAKSPSLYSGSTLCIWSGGLGVCLWDQKSSQLGPSSFQVAAGEGRSEQGWLKVPAVSTALGDPILHPS